MWINNGPCGEISDITIVEKSENTDFSTSPFQISPYPFQKPQEDSTILAYKQENYPYHAEQYYNYFTENIELTNGCVCIFLKYIGHIFTFKLMASEVV